MTDNSVSNNLPLQLTSFIGRAREMAEVKRLLASTRLLTLTGAGGCGKTRLALQVAKDLLDSFPNGVWFVDLAPLSNPAFVLNTVAAVLGVREEAGRPLLATLMDWLSHRESLLVLDNCEHLIEACAKFADAGLHACPHLKILATSREPLGIAGESAYRVPSLEFPDPKLQFSIEQLTQCDAVQLFVERATQAHSTFRLTKDNAPAIAQICFRLDGIPLAIELAAARVKALAVDKIAEHLDDRFHLLTGGSRTALPRQQTLRALIDWSYDLLSESERVLLRRLSVFAGGWTLEAAEDVCTDDDKVEASRVLARNDILDLLMRLVDKSLVVLDEQAGETRYRMLETIRQYAGEKLLESGEGERVRARHLNACLQFAEAAAPKLSGRDQVQWLPRLESNHDNLRAALGWALTQGESAAALRLSAALGWFWFVRGHWSEGRQWLQQALALSHRAADPAETSSEYRGWYAKALHAEGRLAQFQGDYAAARALFEESLALFRELGDKQGIAYAFNGLGLVAESQGDPAAARALLESSLALSRELGDKHRMAISLHILGGVAGSQGDSAAARAFHEESLALRRELGDKRGIGFSLANLGDVAYHQGESGPARALLGESLVLFRELGDKQGISRSLDSLGHVAFSRGEYAAARTFHVESLALMRELGNKQGTARCVAGLAEVAQAEGQPQRAVRLLGAVAALLEHLSAHLGANIRAESDRTLAAVQTQLSEPDFNAAWNEGRAMTLGQAIEYALAEQVEGLQPSTSAQPHDPNALTPREIQVLRLALAGLSDAKIAEKLVISRRTVNTHLSSIYSKLGVNSRSAATRYALDHRLI